ncbi:single-stranded DNA-binding protein [Pseudonocardia sp. TRM90224]|uniref:single-stranded DNA-binding protein n=1 Tax=Pseudonocardia sp. TRM90224 TaxID=2812678 RepID=UPI001E481886|nr:single-stranded DNA-binding protein [Pseudonocardia sp. TRM90224]
MNQNHVMVVGRVCSEITMSKVGDGIPRATFRIATNDRKFDKKTGAWVDGPTVFLPVTCWRGQAENVGKSLSMGDPIVVHGRLYPHVYDRDGRQGSVLTLDASVIGPDLTWCTVSVARVRRRGGEGRGGGNVGGSVGGDEPVAAGVAQLHSPAERGVEEVGEPEWSSGPLVRPSEREVAVSA